MRNQKLFRARAGGGFVELEHFDQDFVRSIKHFEPKNDGIMPLNIKKLLQS